MSQVNRLRIYSMSGLTPLKLTVSNFNSPSKSYNGNLNFGMPRAVFSQSSQRVDLFESDWLIQGSEAQPQAHLNANFKSVNIC